MDSGFDSQWDLMDNSIRSAKRSGDMVSFLVAKNRVGQLSESMKRILCVLGYEPMVLAIGGPPRPSFKHLSYHNTHYFCSHMSGVWFLQSDNTALAGYLMKKEWSRRVCCDVLKIDERSQNYLGPVRFKRVLRVALYKKQFRQLLTQKILTRLTS